MEYFVRNPDIQRYPGIRVTKDTKVEFNTENVQQKIEGLEMVTTVQVKEDRVEAVYTTKIQLEEGDILIYEEEGRGYIKPVESFVTIPEAIEDLTILATVG